MHSKLCLELYSIGAPSIADKLRAATTASITWDQFMEVSKGKPLRQKSSGDDVSEMLTTSKQSPAVQNSSGYNNGRHSSAASNDSADVKPRAIDVEASVVNVVRHISSSTRISVASLLRPPDEQVDDPVAAPALQGRSPFAPRESRDAMLAASRDYDNEFSVAQTTREPDAEVSPTGRDSHSGNHQRRVSWGDRDRNLLLGNSGVYPGATLDMGSGDEDDHDLANLSDVGESPRPPAVGATSAGGITIPKSPTSMRVDVERKFQPTAVKDHPFSQKPSHAHVSFVSIETSQSEMDEPPDDLRASVQSQTSQQSTESVRLGPPLFTTTTPTFASESRHHPHNLEDESKRQGNVSLTKPPLHSSSMSLPSRNSPRAHQAQMSSSTQSGDSSSEHGQGGINDPDERLVIPLPPLTPLAFRSGVIIEGWLDKRSSVTGLWLSVSLLHFVLCNCEL
jgi:hypothetical protein